MELEEVFSPDGPLAASFPAYRYRESQVEMAETVDKVFREGGALAVEAGTGIGKSFAYLVPAFLSIGKEKWRFVIATSTITLQKQLFDKDIPLLMEALGTEVPVAVLYGRSNYLCVRKYREGEDLLSDELGSGFRGWVKSTRTGAFPDLPSSVKDTEIGRYRSESRTCFGSRCPYFTECFYYQSRRKADQSRLIVTNHHLLLLDAKARLENDEPFSERAVLPSYDAAVVDEAHHISDEATEVLSSLYSSELVYESCGMMTRKEQRFGGSTLLDFLSIDEVLIGTGQAIKEELEILKKEVSGYDEVLWSLLLKSKLGSTESASLVTPEFYESERAEISKAKGIAASAGKLMLLFRQGYNRESPKYPQYLDYLSKLVSDIVSASAVLESWMSFSDWKAQIPYLFLSDRKAKRAGLKIAPMTPGEHVAGMLSDKLRSIVYCSATLTVRDSFKYFLSETGLEEGRAETAVLPSPFDYRRNLLLLIPVDGARYDNQRVELYEEYLATTIESSVEAAGGGALVLFTSRKTMRAVHSSLKDRIPELLMQDEMPKGSLLEEFRSRPDSTLFALSSFWEGIDMPGDTLRLVIITKLPFPGVYDPLSRARRDYADSENGNGFMSFDLPCCILKLKQGIGRLIRTEEDRGIVMILDSRIVTKAYSRLMLSSLPQGSMPMDMRVESLPRAIESFLY